MAKAKPAKKTPAVKKPATKKPAAGKKKEKKKKATTKPKKQPADLVALAMAGDLEGLTKAIDPMTSEENDDEMYKWLEVAASHAPTARLRKAAESLSADMLEVSSLRYDDDQMATGAVHFELGVAYLTGADGLPRDLTRAADQLAMAKERYYPWSIQGGDKLLTKTSKALPADARAVFDRIYDGTKPAPSEADGDDDY